MLRRLLRGRHRFLKLLVFWVVLWVGFDYLALRRRANTTVVQTLMRMVKQDYQDSLESKTDVQNVFIGDDARRLPIQGPALQQDAAAENVKKIEPPIVERDNIATNKTAEKSPGDTRNENIPESVQDMRLGPFQNIPDKLLEVGPVVPNVRVSEVNCAALFANDLHEMKKAEVVSRLLVPGKDYINMTANCTDFLWRRRYTLVPVSDEEAQWPIAFSLLMFHDVQAAERLLRAMYRPQNVYCVHVDRKSSDTVFRAMQGIVDCLPNVFMADERTDVRWGRFSIVEPELQCLRQLWAHPVKWKYFINLTGQEFPLKTNLQLVKIMKSFNGANNMEGTVKRKNKVRTSVVWVNGRKTGMGLAPPPYNITVSKGSVHILVQRGYVDFLLHNHMAHAFVNWTRFTDVPDETLFSSLNFSPQIGVPGAYLGTPETDLDTNPFLVRFKNWMTGIFRESCGGKWVRSICILGVRDLPRLRTRPQLIANKFHSGYQPMAYECLEELHYNRTRAEINGHTYFNTTYYATRDFVKHHVS